MRLARLLGWVADQLDRVTGQSTRPESDWPADPRTHDYTDRRWGHDYSIREIKRNGYVLLATGWGPLGNPNIKRGDYLVFLREGGTVVPNLPPTTRYRVAKIEYENDPSDMWKAELWWHGMPEVQTDWDPADQWKQPPTARTVERKD